MPALTMKHPINQQSTNPIELQIIGPEKNKDEVLLAIRSYGYRFVSESVRLEEAYSEFSGAEALIAAREKSGFTQKQLAEKSGISRHVISSLENRKKQIDESIAKKFSTVFDLDYRIFLNPNKV